MPAKPLVPFAFESPDAALDAIAEGVTPVDGCQVELAQATGRVLAQDVLADRPSPAADVSAMDGYAIRMGDLDGPIAPVVAEMAPGKPAIDMPASGIVRIFTGALVPRGADAVIKREDTQELPDSVTWTDSARKTGIGQHIRRRGENGDAGVVVIPRGTTITPATIATLANFGVTQVSVSRLVRIAIVTTGDEVIEIARHPEAYQLRNSNAASMAAMVTRCPGAQCVLSVHAADDRRVLERAINTGLSSADAIWLSGGVSMGDYDYVPEVVSQCGGQVVFHGLPIRPGKPILGAVTADGKPILGFPGNPVSATVNAHRFGLPLLRRAAGATSWRPTPTMVEVSSDSERTIPLHHFRLVQWASSGEVLPVKTRGSGDLVSLGNSEGYVAIEPNQTESGRWPFYRW